VVAELGEPVREKILEVQRWADPRLAAGTPPHITMAGSSGVGPLPLGTPVELLRERIEPITRETAPITMRFERPHRFMQTDIIVLPLDPHGPLARCTSAWRQAGSRSSARDFSSRRTRR
jgi:hypothetical protein